MDNRTNVLTPRAWGIALGLGLALWLLLLGLWLGRVREPGGILGPPERYAIPADWHLVQDRCVLPPAGKAQTKTP